MYGIQAPHPKQTISTMTSGFSDGCLNILGVLPCERHVHFLVIMENSPHYNMYQPNNPQ